MTTCEGVRGLPRTFGTGRCRRLDTSFAPATRIRVMHRLSNPPLARQSTRLYWKSTKLGDGGREAGHGVGGSNAGATK